MPRALRRYEHVRAARTRPIVNSGPRIARVTTARSVSVRWLRDTAFWIATRIVPARANGFYRWLLNLVFIQARADPHRQLRRP